MRSKPLGWQACLVLLVSGLAFGGANCGGPKQPAKEPKASASASASAAPPVEPGVTGAMAEVGPLKMNEAAKAAYTKGISAYVGGDLVLAKQSFERAIQLDARAYQAEYSLGVVLERQGDPQAASAYRRAFTSDYTPALVAYALHLAKRGNLAEAETFVQQKRASLPNSAPLLAALAEVKSLQRDTASAQKFAQEALKKDSDYRPAMVVIARDHYRNRRLDLALYALQAILDGFGELNPPRDKDNAEAHYLRGLILKEEERRAAAVKELREAVRLRPDLVGARLELANFALEAGNAAEALPHLESAMKYDASNVIVHLNLADCYRLAGRTAEARKEFEWVLAKDSSLPQPRYDLALLYLFAPSVPGMTSKQQVDQAIVEITKYQQMRGRTHSTQADDSDELLNRAKQKLADIQAQATAKEPALAPGSAAAPTSSAGSGSTALPAGSPSAGAGANTAKPAPAAGANTAKPAPAAGANTAKPAPGSATPGGVTPGGATPGGATQPR
jgi:tetratricopeptide (TPR) repeat protein